MCTRDTIAGQLLVNRETGEVVLEKLTCSIYFRIARQSAGSVKVVFVCLALV